jgi:predicted MFS family arabinose efflux permease
VTGPNLTGPGARVAALLGLPELAGVFVFSTAAFTLAGAAVALALRPDPLLLARGGSGGPAVGSRRGGLRTGLAAVAASPTATLALAGIALSHGVMVMIMTMTPVHMSHGGAALSVVGLTISLHIAGMYALSPVVGQLADRFGRIPVLLSGQVILLTAAAVSASAGHDETLLVTGLVLLGLGWSFAVVSGSALLAESVGTEAKPGAQGTSDLLMNLAGAGCGAASGALLALVGFTGLNTLAAALTVPVFLLALRAARRAR